MHELYKQEKGKRKVKNSAAVFVDVPVLAAYLLAKFQSAYRQFHSTETALLRVRNDILRAIDEGQEVVLVLLDLSSAFDTIDHKVPLDRLRIWYGFSGTVLDWFRS